MEHSSTTDTGITGIPTEVHEGVGGKYLQEAVLHLLQHSEEALWSIGYDEYSYEPHFRPEDPDGSKISDTGLLLHSLDLLNKPPRHLRYSDVHTIFAGSLNGWAELVTRETLDRSKYKFENTTLVRVLWNYYSRASSGLFHSDLTSKEKGVGSIVYNLTSTDGGTVIKEAGGEEVFVGGNAGTTILFNGQSLHRGVGPTLQPKRYCVNILFTYDNLQYK